MTKFSILFLLFVPLANSETWIQIGDGIECPDVLELYDSTYQIFNDCYGTDPRVPLIESGKLELEDGHLSFFERDVKYESFMQHSKKSQRMKIIWKSSDSLILENNMLQFNFRAPNVHE